MLTDFLIEAVTATCFSSSSDEEDEAEGMFGFGEDPTLFEGCSLRTG